ncbi:hypothetical protein FAK_02400 [Desulfoferula mesophila]|uniref:Uncharacterized protein n=1 Tax=Desulfoferula mesophila TaxID=3058419 RepID=A0AAU9EF35_9BACT|nr:hypothetical protein FAK_02400 [Desulfoferula mesophilus]
MLYGHDNSALSVLYWVDLDIFYATGLRMLMFYLHWMTCAEDFFDMTGTAWAAAIAKYPVA